jgi:hypothetical protein
VRVHVLFTLLACALATAYRKLGEQDAMGGESGGWQRWRRPLPEQTRDKVVVVPQEYYGIFHLAESALLLGAMLQDVQPNIASLLQVFAQ